ncbi:MAG: hypothetical protein WCP53_13190 [Verrucomicrobiota bacterium]
MKSFRAERTAWIRSQTIVTWVHNLLPVAWNGPGSGNLVAGPQLIHVPRVAETQFTT